MAHIKVKNEERQRNRQKKNQKQIEKANCDKKGTWGARQDTKLRMSLLKYDMTLRLFV